MREINNYTLSKDGKHIIFEHEDPYGGCSHELSVYKIRQLLKTFDKTKFTDKKDKNKNEHS